MTALSVNTNTAALGAQLDLRSNTGVLNTSLERLSTGLRINASSDDPSGLVISEFQRAQIAGLDQAVRNVDRAISLSQTAEGGLSEINALLIEIRTLAVDSANNGALDNASLNANQENVNNLIQTIDRIANNTRFGTFNLLDGSSGLQGFSTDSTVTFLSATQASSASATPIDLVVATAASRATVAAGTGQTATLLNDETLIVNGVDILLQGDTGDTSLPIVPAALNNDGLNQAQVVDRINEFTGQTGVVAFVAAGNLSFRTVQFGRAAQLSVVSDTAAAVTSSGVGTTPLVAAPGAGGGVDAIATFGVDTGGAAVAAVTQGNVITGADGSTAEGVSISLDVDPAAANNGIATVAPTSSLLLVDNSRSFQVGAFANDRASLTLSKSDSGALAIGVAGNQFSNLSQIDLRSVSAANDALAIVDAAIAEISTLRGTVGAFQQNTLEATQSNLRVQLLNLQDAESVLRDTDFTSEITNFTSAQIRQQAATAVLGLANQSSLSILNLLQSDNGN